MSIFKTGVILCGCRGVVSEAINLKQVANLLKKLDGVEVEVVDDLCSDQKYITIKEMASRVDALVIAGCTDELCVKRFRDIIGETELLCFACDFVNLKQECSKVFPRTEAEKSALAAIQVCLEKLRAGHDLAKKAVPVKKGREMFASGESLTRRQFFRLPMKLVRYEEIPVFSIENCIAYHSTCQVCIENCPAGALVKDDSGKIHLKGEICQKCGLCSVVCPSDCFEMPTFSNSQAAAMLSVLACTEQQLVNHKLIFTCDQGRKQIDNLIESGVKMPEFFIIRVPCLASISPLVLLWVMKIGYHESVLFCPESGCGKQTALKKWEQVFQSIERLSGCFDISFDWELIKNMTHVTISTAAVEALQKASPACSPRDNCVSISYSSIARDEFLSLLESMVEKVENCQPINNLILPFYNLDIDTEKCSMCGVCTRNCPLNAIVMTEDEESVLQFSHYKCLGCGTCAAKCPEKAIDLNRSLDLSKLLDRSFQVKYRNEVARCEICNRPIGKKATLQKVEHIMKAKGLDSAVAKLYRCETCKVLDGFEGI